MGVLGNIIDQVGTNLHLPELGVSELFAGPGGTTNTYNYQAAQGKVAGPASPYYLQQSAGYNGSPLISPQVGSGAPGGNVLGTSTVNTNPPQPKTQTQSTSSGGGGSDWGTIFRTIYPGWNEAAAKADFAAHPEKANQGGGGGSSYEELINGMYGPTLAALNQAGGNITTGQNEDIAGINSLYGTNQNKTNAEKQDLLTTLQNQAQGFGQNVQSAYAEGRRAYNNLLQQAQNRFGGGISTGAAVSDLAGQQYLRSQGQIQQQELGGQKMFAQETSRIGTYIQGKLDDLGSWKDDAIKQINQNARSALQQVDMQKALTEQQKATTKMEIMTQIQNQAQQIAQNDKQFRQGLAMFAVQSAQSVAQKAFTPQEFAGVYNDMINQTLSGLTNMVTGPSSSSLLAAKGNQGQNDPFQQTQIY